MLQQISLAELNSLDQEGFTQALSTLFEGRPWIVNHAWESRPFVSFEQLYNVLCHVMLHAPLKLQLELLQAHPELASSPQRLSLASQNEQGLAALQSLSTDDLNELIRLNHIYREHFSFPFILCMRAHPKTNLLTIFRLRLQNSLGKEQAIALNEVAKICAYRFADLCGLNVQRLIGAENEQKAMGEAKDVLEL